MLRSSLPDVDIPAVALFDYLFADIDEQTLDTVAIIDGTSGAETTYRQLIGQIQLFAGALAARGVGVGDRVAVLCPNVPAFATVFHGILRSGATATTINSLYTAEEIAAQLEDAGAHWLVTVGPLLAGAKDAAARRGIPMNSSSCSTAPRGIRACATCSARGIRHRTSTSTPPRTSPSSPTPRARPGGRRA